MAHYTLVRNGRVIGTQALTDAMADRLAARGTQVIPTAEPVRAAWVPGRAARKVRLAQERPSFQDVIAGGRRG
jgi:type IV secretory pathway ATPase VirB11/archaellum biosynthesis ATPase